MQPPPLPPSPSGSEWSRQHLGRPRAPGGGSREGRAGGHGKAPSVVPGSALCSLAFDQNHLAISRQSNGEIHLKHRHHPSPAPASFPLSGSPLTAIPAPLPHEHPVMVSDSSPPLDAGTQLFFLIPPAEPGPISPPAASLRTCLTPLCFFGVPRGSLWVCAPLVPGSVANLQPLGRAGIAEQVAISVGKEPLSACPLHNTFVPS